MPRPFRPRKFMKLSIIVPTYNERANIKPLLETIRAGSGGRDYEVIVVDDHSDYGTLEELTQEQANYPLKIFRKTGKKGKAYSLIKGLEKARGEVIPYIDADLQYPPEEIFPMVDKLEEADVVVANRKG